MTICTPKTKRKNYSYTKMDAKETRRMLRKSKITCARKGARFRLTMWNPSHRI